MRCVECNAVGRSVARLGCWSCDAPGPICLDCLAGRHTWCVEHERHEREYRRYLDECDPLAEPQRGGKDGE